MLMYSFFFLTQQNLVGQGPHIIEDSRSQSDISHSVGLLQTSDQPVAKTSIWKHTALTKDRHPCFRRDSNPQSQRALDRAVTGICSVPIILGIC